MSGLSNQALQTPRPASPQAAFGRRHLFPQLDTRGWQNATLLGLWLALQFAGIVFTPLGGMDADTLQGLGTLAALGSCLAPPTLLAFWAVFGPGRLTTRLPLMMWLAAAFYVTILFAAMRENGGNAAAAGTSIGLTGWLLAFVYAQLPLWLIRGLRHWRFVPTPGVEATGSAALVGRAEAPRNQFTLRGLLGWTLAAAIPLAAFRALMPEASFDAETLFAFLPFVVIGGLVVALAGLPIVPLAWIFLAAGRRPVLRLVLSLLALAGLPGGLWLLADLFDGPDFSELIPIVAGSIANGVITLLVIGACGYRLDRPRRPRTEDAERCDGAIVAARRPLSRSRFAFALAPLLGLAAAIVCVVPYQLRLWRQAAITAEWGRSGVQVSFDEAGKLSGVHGINPASVSDELLQQIAELDDLEYFELGGATISDRQLALLAPLGRLRTLELCDCGITDAGLGQLVQFKNLEILNLTNTCITDAGLARLKALPKLSSLDLQLTAVTDAGLAALADVPRLSGVDVSLTAVTAAGAKRFIAACPSVSLEYGASDALLARRLVNQRSIVMTNVPGGVNRGIAVQPRPLKRLHAHGKYSFAGGVITVTDAGLRPLAQLTELEELDLHDTAVTDQGLNVLSTLTALKKLDLRGTKVTEQGIATLAQSLPECQILR